MTNIAAIVLAAGSSERFGQPNKLLADLSGRSVVRRAIEAVAGGSISDIVVVTGSQDDRLARELALLPVRLAQNAEWKSGMGSSIAKGMATLRDDADGVFIVPGDMALLSCSDVQRLIAVFDENGAERAVYPATRDGEQRNPVLWPRRYFADLARMKGTGGGKALLHSLGADAIAVCFDNADTLLDIDTPQDLEVAAQLLMSVKER